jgi:DNA-binding FrmR family transcriptional regulator
VDSVTSPAGFRKPDRRRRCNGRAANVVIDQKVPDRLPPERSDVDHRDGPHKTVTVEERRALLSRLNRVEGQIRGIRRMVQEPRACIDLLQQLAAAEAALNRISLAVFKHHVDYCVMDAMSRTESDRHKQVSELVDIFDRFAK